MNVPGRDPSTQVRSDLEVGAKVRVEYRMIHAGRGRARGREEVGYSRP
jgi:hypothetical protein